MARQRPASEGVQRAGRDALHLLQGSEFVSIGEVARRTKRSVETVKRAFEWLRDQGAHLEYVAGRRSWTLRDKTFALPFSEPTVDDLVVALLATGLLNELSQAEGARRARRLFEELAQRVEGGRATTLRATSLRVTQTTSVVRNPELMLLFLRAARRQVLRIRSVSAWTDEARSHDFEPWQVWLHDGVPYVRGYSRTRRNARTFALANIESAEVVVGTRPGVRIPDDPWSGDDPRFGMDNDRPGTAIVRLRGGVARWVASLRWHPHQRDEWIEPREILERTLDYRSCRELARRLVSLGDGLVSVEPLELREETARLASRALAAFCAPEPS